MKKIYALVCLLILTILISIVGCGAPAAITSVAPPATVTATKTVTATATATAKASAGATTPAQPQVIKWNMQSQYSAASNWTIFFGNEYADWVRKMTNGRLDITVYPAGTFAKTTDLLPAVGKGLVDALIDYAGYYPDTVPISNIESGLPMAWDQFLLPYDAYYNRGFLDLVRQAYAQFNVYPLAMINLAADYNIGTTFPLKSIADIKGKKIRAVGVYGDWIQALGAVPTVVSESDRYMALKTGIIDGYVATTSSLQTAKFAELIKYYVTGTVTPCVSSGPQINIDKWNALPQDIKDFLAENTKYFYLMASLKYAQGSKAAEAWAVSTQGMKWVTLSPEDEATERQAALNLWDQIAAKDQYAAKGVGIVKQQLKDAGLLQ